jgi:hypothetical protein
MIYNRTYIDIINAKKIFTNKVQNFIELSDNEQSIIDKAFFNVKAINRITNKINEIWDIIILYGGTKAESDDVREWNEQEFFNIVNFGNIRQNIADLIVQIGVLNFVDVSVYERAYNILTDEYVYTNLNNLEKLLYDIYDIFNHLVLKQGNNIFIFGSYNATLNEGDLYIE